LPSRPPTHEQLATYIQRYREIVKLHLLAASAPKIEQTKDMLSARQFVHQGDRAYAEGLLEAARDATNKVLKTGEKCSTDTPR